MKNLKFKLFGTMFILTALSASLCQAEESIPPDTSNIKKYPYLVVIPSEPVAQRDTVKIHLLLGKASNSCMAPTYKDLTYKIEQSPLDVYPPIYIVKVWYKEIPSEKICIDLYDPVAYGPEYNLGILNAGKYNVVSGDDPQLTYGSFSVVTIPSTGEVFSIKGTVYHDVYPLKIMNPPIQRAKIVITAKSLPLANENIIVKGKDSTYTNESGQYSFTNLTNGVYEIVCSHPEYRTVSTSINISSDTIKNFLMVSIDSYVSLTGTVKIIRSLADVAPFPVEGCTVMVSKNDLTTFKADENTLKAITDKNGRYLFEKIPITANGEVWFVKAYFKNYSAIEKIKLYNLRTDTLNFTFQDEYENKDSIIVKGIIFKTAASKFLYNSKEPVKIRYSITNTTEDTVTFGPFSGSCEYDLIVKKAEEDITLARLVVDSTTLYKASDHMVCIAMITYIKVAPGQTIIKDFPDWYLNENIFDSNLLPPQRRYINLMFYAKLMGEKYDYTTVGINVKIDLTPVGTLQKAVSITDNIIIKRDAISLDLSKAQTITVTCYDLKGKVVPQLSFVKNVSAGRSLITFENKNISKGFYVVKIKGADFEKRVNTLLFGK